MTILNCNCGGKWATVGPFFLRVVTGLIFFMHGWQKWEGGAAQTAGFLDTLGFPAPMLFAIILIALELVGGAALILGLLTHWVAKALMLVALVALFTVHAENGFFMATGGYEFILLILASCTALVFLGSGRWSLDALILKRK